MARGMRVLALSTTAGGACVQPLWLNRLWVVGRSKMLSANKELVSMNRNVETKELFVARWGAAGYPVKKTDVQL